MSDKRGISVIGGKFTIELRFPDLAEGQLFTVFAQVGGLKVWVNDTTAAHALSKLGHIIDSANDAAHDLAASL